MIKYLYPEHFPLCGAATTEVQMGGGWSALGEEDPELHRRRTSAAASLPRKRAAEKSINIRGISMEACVGPRDVGTGLSSLLGMKTWRENHSDK